MTTIQDVFSQFYSQYKEVYGVSAQQAKAAEDIINCRTKELGGHVYQCDECGDTVIQYNSCRNRHCPLCQGINKVIWLDQRNKDILNVPYFHVVFTMPKELHPLIYQNQKLLYALMYKCVAETLLELCRDKKYLGAQIGFFSMLHTWGKDLRFHPHTHNVLMAGGLTKNNQWVNGSKKFFIPVKVLSKKFRGKFIYHLKKYYSKGKLNFYNDTVKYLDSKVFQDLIDQCYAKDWYSYSKRTFSGPQAVIKYLGRYTHRIAISNDRIVSMDKDSVTINVRDEENKNKTVTLTGIEFIRRFLMHTLPKGFVKVRYYGLLANRNRKTKLVLSRKLTNSISYKPVFEGLSTIEILCILLERDVTLCPTCKKGKLNLINAFLKEVLP